MAKRSPSRRAAREKPAPAASPRPKAPPRPAARARRKAAAAPRSPPPAPPPAPAPPRALPAGTPPPLFEIDPGALEEGLKRLSGELQHWANKGLYTRVRLKFRGRQVLPDLPLAAFLAAEGLAFYWAGILRALLVNVGGASLLQVELVSDADKEVQRGKEALLSGEVDEALAHFQQALAMDRDYAAAHLHVGIAHKLKGERGAALAAFERARALDPQGSVGAEAERLAGTLRPPTSSPVA